MNGRGRWLELQGWGDASCEHTNRFSGTVSEQRIWIPAAGSWMQHLASLCWANNLHLNLISVQDSGSDISVESCDSECVSLSPDEGEAHWDALGRMNSTRRSSRFNKPRLISVTLRSGADGYGIQLEGRSPPTIASLSQFTCQPCYC